MSWKQSPLALALAVFVAVLPGVACGGGQSDPGTETDVALRQEIREQGLRGDPAVGIEVPSIDSPLAVLGRKLFFSKTLGGDEDSACVTCHHPVLGGGDGLAQSIGVGAVEPDLLGPGRTHPDGDLTVPRNAPSTFNLALWETGLFWDSRVELLEDGGIRTPDSEYGVADPNAGESISAAQTRFPVTSAEEMRGFEFALGADNEGVREALVARLSEDEAWRAEFGAVFDSSEVTYARIAEAMAAYEDSQLFTDTPWAAYVRGQLDAISDAAKRGALLFFRTVDEGGADCASCHVGDFFTDEAFHSVAAPQIGRGKGDGFKETNDFGRARESADRNDRFAFRTPTLLNVSATGPYFHSGAYDELADVVRHQLDPRDAVLEYEPSRVPMAASEDFETNRQEMLDFLDVSGRAIDTYATPISLGDSGVDDLVAFLESLTDPCVLDRDCLAPWIADPVTDDVDGGLLLAVDDGGKPL